MSYKSILLFISSFFGLQQLDTTEMTTTQQSLIGKQLVSTPLTTTEFHAGGILFSIIYEEVLEVQSDSTVILTQRVTDEFRPMDQHDINMINKTKLKGKLVKNSRGYIEMVFEHFTLIGLPSVKQPNLYVFAMQGQHVPQGTNRIYYLQ